ncbi:hypothetical protein [Runella slithyformis]|uniref:Uncharacterized protein n=1 Tax=Runella slithyformis (strain ATCC 29530 / DSM 19594 / LMG 11500 / NCIMB 11436 / LSU 4) TaxID=761193 RepID=A0A7U3ZGG8_RUNSL|nr:hypothetical protein [Runella slithyformis]AEI46786.1 hypothetical protein Runsl_0334 [Runella slithyformis DSM 19594]
MKTFVITYGTETSINTFRVRAKNRAVARAKFKEQDKTSKILSISEDLTPEKKAIQEAAAQGMVKVGVQKSMQLGFSDLPLFQEKNQLDLF